MSRSSVYELVARYRVEGDAAFEPRSRRPKRSPRATPPATLELIAELRQRLTAQGLDAGSDTIRWHLDQHHHIRASRATIDRHLRRAGHAATQRRAVSAHSRRTRRLSHALDRRNDRPARPTRASRSGDALPRPWRPPLQARHANGPWPPAHRSSTRRRRGGARTTARRSSTWPPPAAQRTAPRSPHRRHPRSLSTTGVAGTPIRAERNLIAEVLTCCSTRRASGGAVWVVRRGRSE